MIGKIILILLAMILLSALFIMLGMLIVLLFDDLLYYVFDTSIKELIEKYRGVHNDI